MGTEERIQEAALKLFATKGFAGTGIRDIAQEAGISVASLYHYMSTKDDLLVDIMEVGMRRLLWSAAGLREANADPVVRLVALVRLHVWVHAVRQQTALVCDTEVRSLSGDHLHRIRTLRDEYESHWRTTIRQGTAEGSMRVMDPTIASFALLEMCTGVSHWYRADGPTSLLEICDIFADAALGLVRAMADGRAARLSDFELPDPASTYRIRAAAEVVG